MPKNILILVTLFGLAQIGISQRHIENADILYMEDGSIYLGNLIDKSLSNNFLLSTGDTITIDPFEIHRRKTLADVIMYNRGSYHYKTGYFGYIYGGGGGSLSGGASHFSGVFGKRITDKYSLGGGVSIDYYNETVAGFWVEHAFTTIFGYGRYYLTQTKARIYLDTRLGYGLKRDDFFTEDHTNGINFQPGVGIHLASKGKLKFHLSLARSMQYVSADAIEPDFFSGNNIEIEYNIWHSHTVFTVGIEAW